MKTDLLAQSKQKVQDSSDKLYSHLEYLASKEKRTKRDQKTIDVFISVLKNLPTIKPIEFNRFN